MTSYLRKVLPPNLPIDFTSNATVLVSIFKKVITPEITLDKRQKICVPERFSVQVGSSRDAFVLLLHFETFTGLPADFKQSFLDILFLVLKGNVYNIIRFQCTGEGNGIVESFSLNPILINLLDRSIAANVHTSTLKKIINLIGIVGTAGMAATDLKAYLNFLRTPSELSVALLQALKIMLGQDHITSDVRVKKASPAAIFDFGGSGSGLTTHLTTFPFSREYQFCTWFRVENFEGERHGYQQRAFNPTDLITQHVLTWQNAAQKGMDIFIDQKTLCVAISTSSREPTFIRLMDCPLQRGVWYHITVRHAKPRLALFSSDELTIYIEDQLVFQDSVRFPSLGSASDMQFSFGTNFDGQMSPIYLMSESLPQGVVKMVAGLDAGRPVEGIDNGFNPVVVDLLPSVTSSDRKVHPVLPKMTMVYHPSRCLRGHALDIHSGRHAKLGALTQTWLITNARDLLNSMGGLSCILPLFPRLLIENESYRSASAPSSQNSPYPAQGKNNPSSPYSPSPKGQLNFSFAEDSLAAPVTSFTGLGDTLADLHEESVLGERDLDHATLRLLKQEREEYLGEGSVGLLLSIIAKCVVAHRLHQQELVTMGGIEMIEYALTCTPQEIMQGEGERCVFSLRELQKSASDLPTLERRIAKSLLCNFAIWHRASFQLVSGLMSVILEAIKVRPALFVSLLGVKPVLDSLEFFTSVDENADYYVFDGNDVKAPVLSREESLEAEKNTLKLENLEHKDGEFKREKKEPTEKLPNPAVQTKPAIKNASGRSDGVGFTEGSELTITSPSGSAKRRGSRAGSNGSSASGLLSLSTVHEDEENFSDFSNPASTRSGVAFVGFGNDNEVTTPTSVSRSSSSKLKNIKRMKSFKLAMTEVIQDGVEEEELAQEREMSTKSVNKRNSFRLRKHSIDSIAEEDGGDIVAALNDSSHGIKSQNASHANSAFTMESGVDSNVALDGERADSTRSMEGSEYNGAALGYLPPPQSPEQRKHLRDCLEAMVVALVLHGGSDKEVSPILDYMVMCKDRVVLNEIAQILLYLIVERGSKFMNTIIMACNGPEEFASFVLLYLVHQPYEELRCSGVRILTHFYLRVDQIPPSVVNMTMKARRKGSIISRAIPTIGQNNSQGLQRLQLCGGLALLCEVISSHSKASSELTYSALLELLLTKPGAKCQVTVQYTDLFELSGVVSAPVSSPTPQPNTFRGRLSSLGGASGTNVNTFNSARGHAGRSSVVFAADYLSPDQVHDEGVDMMNSVALPIFFELLPKLPVRVQGQIYGDLLALLKHSEGNCHAFVSSASWQLCMFGLVSQLVALSDSISGGKAVNTMSLLSELERWTGYVSVESPFLVLNGKSKRRASTSAINPPGEVLRTWRNATGQMSNNNSYSYQSDTKPSTKHMSMSIPASVTAKLLEAQAAISNAATISPTSTLSTAQDDHDLWFAIGMKIYATLLLHSIEFKNGWKEIDRSISQSYESDVGYSVAQTVLSHVLNELTFSMRSKYKELQRLAKSTNSAENQEATDKIENFLCLILTTSQLALVDQRCAINGIKNFHLCKLRVHYFTEIGKEYALSKEAASTSTSTDASKLGTEASSGDIPPSDMRHLLEKTEVQLASKLFCIGEPAAGLGLPNIQYDAEGARAKPLSEGLLAEEEEGDRYYKNLNFFHVWHDLNSDESSPEGSTNSNSNPTPFKSIEELLHPLERNHDLSKGKLVLVLQALRFFDIIFWPTDGTLIRNAEMMRFNKEDKGPAVESTSGKFGAESKKRAASQTYPMSMYSAVMRMCLFILCELSPITHLAVMNVKRMRMLVNSVDKVPQYKTPTHDWLLAALLHTTLNLQRIALALEPVYEMLGLAECILVPSLGPWSDSYDEFDRMDPKDASVFDSVAENSELLMKLQRYFDSSPGRNLIRNVRASLLLLADAFEFHHDKLSASLEERTFRSLWVFVEHFKVDSIIQDPMRASSIDSHQNSDSAPSRSNSIAVGNHDVAGDIFEIPASQSPKLSKRGSSFSFGGNARRYSSSDFRDDVSETSEKFSESGSTQGDRPRSQTTTPVPLEAGEDCFHGSDLLLVLRWLRFPYFRLNPFRSLGVIRAVDALDYLEGRSVNRFAKETQVMKQALEEQQDLAVKSVEEMTELKELSLAVHEMMSNRNDGRVAAVESADNLKLKNIAARWHDCLQTFEEDWSPWRVDEAASPSETIGCAHYELSKHRDSYLRRMATTKLAQPTYHKDAAYLEGKIKDQTAYEQGIDAIDLPAPAANSSATRGLLPFKSRAANDKSGTNTSSSWGDDDEDVIVEEASNANIIAAGISTLLYWNEKRPHWTYVFHWAPDEKLMFESEAMHIQLDQTVAGSVILTNKCLYFHSRKHMGGLAVTQQPFTDKCWHLDRVVEAYGRRYLLQNCAIELFFIDAVELFLAFKSMSELHRFFRFLRRQSLPLLVTPKSLNPKYAFANSPWTEMWRRRQISNFEYLMRLNVMAGRSFNDITQYPVFPWVISDFTSDTIDLSNPHSFRRLDLPIGALNPTRLDEFLERFRSFDDDTVPKFMYGSHYSSAGVVLHYMVRQEPFTTLAINLQGGRFDCPDRVFFELNRTWDNCNQSMSDVKEMIPELFSCPEALLNTNNLPLGELQEGGKVGDVLLPPWAKDAYDFIRINRAALESDYVSENLPAWIDLIFGYKQTGQAAVNAHNVFYYLTYENAINIESIEDPLQREAAKAQVTHFGQTPSQLLNKEHPRKIAKDDCIEPLCSDIPSISNIQLFTPTSKQQNGASNGAVVGISCYGDRLVVCHANLSLAFYRWSAFPEDDNNPFTLRADRVKVLPSAPLSSSEEILRGRSSLLPTSSGPDGYYSSPSQDNGKTIDGGLFAAFRKSSPFTKPRASSIYTSTQESFDDLFTSGAPERSISRRPSALNTGAALLTSCSSLSHMNVALNIGEVGTGRVITCGYWDNSLKVHSVETLREIGSSKLGHQGAITCVQQGGVTDAHTLITGGVDGTVRVWIFEKPHLVSAFSPEPYFAEVDSEEVNVQGVDGIAPAAASSASSTSNPANCLACVHVLWGHQSPVRCISYSSVLDMVLSGGEDGRLCLHSVRTGKYVRSITHAEGASIDLVVASAPGYLVAHSWHDLQIHVFWLNGQHLLSTVLPCKIECMVTNSTGQILITGSSHGLLSFREIWSLQELYSIDMNESGAIRSLSFTEDHQYLLIGSEDGTFSIATDPEARWRNFHSALQKTPILGSGI